MRLKMNQPFDPALPYRSQRQPVLARNVVATSQPLATSAGLAMLRAGGNAIDAALAAAITLSVVEPTSNGLGSDLFAMVWDGSELHGLNASGRSSANCTADAFAGETQMPVRGWKSVTVPGAVSGWFALSRRFGALPFEKLFEPAIEYARHGFLVSPVTAAAWQRSVERLNGFDEFMRIFAPSGRAPAAGEVFRCEDHARTLERIAHSKGEDFYRGEIAAKIVAASDGWFTRDDFANHRADFVGTISTCYRDIDVHEIPPNGQGIAALMALGMLNEFDLASHPVDSADSIHLQIEAMKLAFADAHAYVCDEAHALLPPGRLLDPDYLRTRAKLIDPSHASDPHHGTPSPGGTVYLTAADASGKMISLIQSNYMGFGSGIVVPGTGIALQNRGAGFVLTPGHPNGVGPRKRPFHTIIPGFAMKGGQPLLSFGVMGGPMQPQGHVQMITRIFDHGQNPQAASDSPRWQVMSGRQVAVEQGVSQQVIDQLIAKAHEVRIAGPEEFGGAQLILNLQDGYLAASDHRKDGHAAGF